VPWIARFPSVASCFIDARPSRKRRRFTLPVGLFQRLAIFCRIGAFMRCVIFDLDGTLADTAGDLIAAANAALAEMGQAGVLRHGEDDATAFRGGRAMLRLAAERLGRPGDEGLVEAGYPLLLAAYDREIDRHTVLYPRAMEAVERLRQSGVSVGICTNKPEALAEKLMQRLKVRSAFASLVGADTLPVRKPDPAPLWAAIDRAGGARDRACLVGDTVTDRRTAAAAGVASILVTFGPAGDSVAALEPDALLDRFDDLDAVVARLLGAESH
jgi:phosphoglycolate phosphatase